MDWEFTSSKSSFLVRKRATGAASDDVIRHKLNWRTFSLEAPSDRAAIAWGIFELDHPTAVRSDLVVLFACLLRDARSEVAQQGASRLRCCLLTQLGSQHSVQLCLGLPAMLSTRTLRFGVSRDGHTSFTCSLCTVPVPGYSVLDAYQDVMAHTKPRPTSNALRLHPASLDWED